MSVIRPIVAAVALAAFPGCNSADDAVFKSGGNTESKPTPTLLNGVDISSLGGSANAAPTVATVAASVTYAIKVTSNSGAHLCDGSVQLQIMSDFGMKFPQAKIQCVSLTLDLAGILGAGTGMASTTDAGQNLSSDGQVLSIANIAGAKFNPPRPFLIGPIVQDTSQYKGFNKNYNSTLTATDPTTKAPVSAQGSFNVSVQDVDTSYSNNFIASKPPLDKILHWTMTTTGFSGVPATTGLLFSKFEWYWNTRPIMIPKIQIVGELGSLVQDNSGTTNDLVGEITIDLIVTDYNFN